MISFQHCLDLIRGLSARVKRAEVTESQAAKQLVTETGVELPPRLAASLLADPDAAQAVLDQVIQGVPTDLTSVRERPRRP
ncbi:MAG TPA: hypothetical protein VLI05_00450 [Candidatus Saccharimonadia bacterium]|nr:hypothetical protein [Candidatus Saccharimonadia bacterium]